MPDKYGVGLGRNAVSSQYMGVQRPKKRKQSKDPMFIEFDAYDAQDGLMDEHDLNDIAKMRGLLRAGRRLNMSPQELSARAKKGWETRRRGGHPTNPKLDAPISRYGLKYRKGNDRNVEVRTAKASLSDDQWRALPKRKFKPTSLNPTEEFIGSRHVDKVVAGEPLREGYDPYVLIDKKGKAWIVDGHHRAAMYSALGRDMPAHVLDLRKSALRKSLLRKDRDGDGDGFVNDGKPNMRPVGARAAAAGLKGKGRREEARRKARESLRQKGKASHEARMVLERAKANEPKITADVADSIEASGGKMYGLNFRLKEVNSLARKLVTKSREKGVSVEEYGGIVNDAVRYTAIIDETSPGAYTRAVTNLLDSLESKGYEIIVLETHWQRGDAYNGIHLTAQNSSGQKFELQFHTGASAKAKFATHPLYSEMRKDTTSPERRAELATEMVNIADAAPVPQGATELGTPVFRPVSKRGTAAKSMKESGIWMVRDRITNAVLANIRLEYSDGGLRIFIQENGEGSWREDPVSFGLLLGDYGAVEQVA